ncbi:nicotinamide n-methyltransferase [Diaporthe amygdali]|uniref:nicotinamide n-methyltransferase n=1 Tax=Phomopsis amygdali TaxID=1214568 RepID=UPI0022FDDE35|nr:nicotinamide n-methyltransferase [Diaporthe amygdali]KAJ0109985.1 nicotinamide n-methyltransferase [Diaporthe amygdali]
MASSDHQESDEESGPGGNLFAEPEDYYPPSPKPTKQTFTTRDGDVVDLHLVGYSPTEAHHLWNGSRVAAQYFEADPAGTVRDRTVLELGAGAGLPSLVAAALGARRVVMTDFPDADIIATMEKNIDVCSIIPAAGGVAVDKDGKALTKADVIVAKGFVWGFDPLPLLAELPASHPKFDVLVLADLLFRHSEHGKLLDTIRDTMARDAGARAYVFFTSYRPWLAHKDMAFFDLARERGFVVDKVLERKMERPLFEDDPGDEEVRKTCTGWVVRWPREGEGNGEAETVA